MAKAIEIRNLRKTYGELEAVRGISFDVEVGEVFGFLGPNGAGKTTTLEIIEGLRQPTSGETIILGENTQTNLSKIKEKIGVQLQSAEFFDFLTLQEIIELFGSFYSRSLGPKDVLDRVELWDKRGSYVKQLSGGQKQRFSVALALVNDPEVVFLDEPTTGIDPQSRHYLWDIIRSINDEGKTIVLTTHYMEEAQILCDRIAIIDSGTIIACDATADLIAKQNIPYTVTVTLRGAEDLLTEIARSENFAKTGNNDDFVFHMESIDKIQVVLDDLRFRGVQVTNLEVRSANLEDVFLQLTGKALRE